MSGVLAVVVLLLGSLHGEILSANADPVTEKTTGFPFNNTTAGTTQKDNIDSNADKTTLLPADTTSVDGACNITLNCSSDPVTSVKESVPIKMFLSEETYLSFMKYNNAINIFLIMVALILNVINIVVFTSQDRNSTNFYLIAISAMDILFSACILVKTIYQMISEDAYTLFFSTYIVYIEVYFKPVFQRTIFLLVLLVSIERLLVVVFPLKAKSFVFMRRPKSIIMMAFLIPSVYYIFSPLRFKIEERTDQTTNATKYFVGYTNLDQVFLRRMSTTGVFIFVYAPLLGGLILNLLVVCALRRHSKKRQQLKTTIDMDKKAKRERQTTVTIITSSSVFLLLAIPHATNAMAFSLFPSLYGPLTRFHHLFHLIQAACETLSNLSLSTDFVAYVWLSTSFRTTFFGLLRIKDTTTPTRYTDQNMSDTHTS